MQVIHVAQVMLHTHTVLVTQTQVIHVAQVMLHTHTHTVVVVTHTQVIQVAQVMLHTVNTFDAKQTDIHLAASFPGQPG